MISGIGALHVRVGGLVERSREHLLALTLVIRGLDQPGNQARVANRRAVLESIDINRGTKTDGVNVCYLEEANLGTP
jgi:hypothetical protein